jgi:hypothetical protein
MFSKSLLILAAVSSCSYAQQAAADVASSLDSFTQSLSDLETLVKAISTLEQQEVCFRAKVFRPHRTISLTLPIVASDQRLPRLRDRREQLRQ